MLNDFDINLYLIINSITAQLPKTAKALNQSNYL